MPLVERAGHDTRAPTLCASRCTHAVTHRHTHYRSQEVRWHDARDTELSSLDHLLANSISSQMCSSHGSGTSTQQQQQHQLGPGPLPPQHQEQPPQQQHNQQQQPEQQQPECPDKADTEDTDTGSDEVVLFGLVLNVAGQGLMSSLSSLVGGGRHWLAIRWLEGQW